ncbi:MAG: hypothetical protein ACK5PB_17965 [Pirellula sp.]
MFESNALRGRKHHPQAYIMRMAGGCTKDLLT